MRVLKAPFCIPPDGHFAAKSLHIQWVEIDGVQAAAIQTNRVCHFFIGEELRGHTQFWHHDRNTTEEASYKWSKSSKSIK
jgi:hypothetical protein